ncbi:hypothetical protein JW916_15735 [Candidatus Sumerlaeota bacterium]|nr:hypothetical protein [Candidatus Sumerlaeota bacterium]
MRNAKCGVRGPVRRRRVAPRRAAPSSSIRDPQSAIRNRLWLVLPALVALVLGSACSSSKPSATADREREIQGPTLDNVVARIYNESELETVVESTRAVYDMSEKANRLVLSFVRVAFYQKGVLRGEMTGNKGVLYLGPVPKEGIQKDDIFLSGHVQLALSDGTSVSAPEFRYLSEEEKLVSGGGRFEQRRKTPSGETVIRGDRFETNKAMTRLVLVNAEMRPAKSTAE